MTRQIADALMTTLEADGIGVAAEGRHTCMMMRGVEKQNSEIRSSTLRGCFCEMAARREFFTHVMKGPCNDAGEPLARRPHLHQGPESRGAAEKMKR